MTRITYEVVEHDGGWAYKVGDVLSEAFPSHKLAHQAAERAAREQMVAGDTEGIVYEDNEGAGITKSRAARTARQRM